MALIRWQEDKWFGKVRKSIPKWLFSASTLYYFWFNLLNWSSVCLIGRRGSALGQAIQCSKRTDIANCCVPQKTVCFFAGIQCALCLVWYDIIDKLLLLGRKNREN